MAVFDNDVLVAVKAVRAALLADGTLAAGVSNQVYHKLVAAGFSYPYAFIDLNAGADDNSSTANLSDLRLMVKVVGNFKTDYANLASYAGRIYGLLHEGDLSDNAAGWFIWRCQRVSIFDYAEIDGEVAYSHVGGIYRLRLSS